MAIFIGRVGEMEENAKSQDGGSKTLSIKMLKLSKLHLIVLCKLKIAGKYFVVCKYTFHFRLFIYGLHSFM